MDPVCSGSKEESSLHFPCTARWEAVSKVTSPPMPLAISAQKARNQFFFILLIDSYLRDLQIAHRLCGWMRMAPIDSHI